MIIIVLLLIVIILILLQPTAGNETPHLTTTYQNITVPQAKTLIATTQNLSVVDVRGLEGCGQCQFNKGHLPNATRIEDPTVFYNSTCDILVYSVEGSVGARFCDELMNHVYGNVYNLEGGWTAWENYAEPVDNDNWSRWSSIWMFVYEGD